MIIEVTAPVRFATTLSHRTRPVPAGVEIRFSSWFCTLGFNADRSGHRVFVTNSHCSDVHGETDGTRYFQWSPSNPSDFIGHEYVDPPLFTSGACPWFRRCRYSDAAAALYDPGVAWDFGYIARTVNRDRFKGLTIIDDADPRFRITAERATAPLVGTELEKVGVTTGWTYGLLRGSCVDMNVRDTDITLLCQDWVDGGADYGDSGSPVFYWWSGAADVTLFGILWGIVDSKDHFIFSSMPSIEDELGTLATFTPTGTGGEPLPPDTCSDPTVIQC